MMQLRSRMSVRIEQGRTKHSLGSHLGMSLAALFLYVSLSLSRAQCLATVAIDRMASRLVSKDGKFERGLYASLNQDDGLLREIMDCGDGATAAANGNVADVALPSPVK